MPAVLNLGVWTRKALTEEGQGNPLKGWERWGEFGYFFLFCTIFTKVCHISISLFLPMARSGEIEMERGGLRRKVALGLLRLEAPEK